MTISEILAAHVVNANYEDLPADVIDIAKKDILDTLGVAVAALGARALPAPALGVAVSPTVGLSSCCNAFATSFFRISEAARTSSINTFSF